MAQSINLKNSYENSILIVNGTRVYLIVGPEICFQMTTALITIATYTAYKWKKSLYLNMTYSWLYMSCWHLKISMNAFTYSAIEKCILPEITVCLNIKDAKSSFIWFFFVNQPSLPEDCNKGELIHWRILCILCMYSCSESVKLVFKKCDLKKDIQLPGWMYWNLSLRVWICTISLRGVS